MLALRSPTASPTSRGWWVRFPGHVWLHHGYAFIKVSTIKQKSTRDSITRKDFYSGKRKDCKPVGAVMARHAHKLNQTKTRKYLREGERVRERGHYSLQPGREQSVLPRGLWRWHRVWQRLPQALPVPAQVKDSVINSDNGQRPRSALQGQHLRRASGIPLPSGTEEASLLNVLFLDCCDVGVPIELLKIFIQVSKCHDKRGGGGRRVIFRIH